MLTSSQFRKARDAAFQHYSSLLPCFEKARAVAASVGEGGAESVNADPDEVLFICAAVEANHPEVPAWAECIKKAKNDPDETCSDHFGRIIAGGQQYVADLMSSYAEVASSYREGEEVTIENEEDLGRHVCAKYYTNASECWAEKKGDANACAADLGQLGTCTGFASSLFAKEGQEEQ